MPSSRQARRMRRAISPRLAMTTFSSMAWRLFDYEERLADLDRIAVARHDGGDPARAIGLDLIHHLHGLDDAEHLADLHLIADLDERLGARGGAGIEGADHGRRDHVLVGLRLGGAVCRASALTAGF